LRGGKLHDPVLEEKRGPGFTLVGVGCSSSLWALPKEGRATLEREMSVTRGVLDTGRSDAVFHWLLIWETVLGGGCLYIKGEVFLLIRKVSRATPLRFPASQVIKKACTPPSLKQVQNDGPSSYDDIVPL